MRMPMCSLLLLMSVSLPAAAAEPDPLTTTATDLDKAVFEAYNRCDLETFGNFFDPGVAFFHDTGGATFDRQTVLDNTQKYICGKVRRELIPSTLRVYPIKDYGAIEEGEHRFCELATGKCEGIAKFVIVWARRGDDWRISNVLSYGHRTMTAAEKAAMDSGPASGTVVGK